MGKTCQCYVGCQDSHWGSLGQGVADGGGGKGENLQWVLMGLQASYKDLYAKNAGSPPLGTYQALAVCL